MAKSLFEELGGKYERQGDYLIPCLTVPAEEEQAIGIWGQRHLDYLKQYRKVTYTKLPVLIILFLLLFFVFSYFFQLFERSISSSSAPTGLE